MDEIKFYGRGGQGVVMASQMLGYAFFKAGLYPQCFSVFGGDQIVDRTEEVRGSNPLRST